MSSTTSGGSVKKCTANESLTYWSKRDFYATTLHDCNTWLVPADMVG